jgi:hypothetical protein
MNEQQADRVWKWTIFIVGTVATTLVGQLVTRLWRRVTGADIPINRLAGSATRRHVIVWIVVSGAAATMTRLCVVRGTAAAWKRKTGRYPRLLGQ